jgi:epoxyqueuosine reductase
VVTIDRHTDEVKRRARALGFSHCGVAEAGPLLHEEERHHRWRESGYHAGLAWLADEQGRRYHPADVLPGARSVVVVSWNYFSPARHADAVDEGKISRYAWGDDYHRVLKEPLRLLEDAIRAQYPGCAARSYADTGPVNEKAWAARAGVGWQGKHTNCITRDAGSWLFLAVILTDAALAPDGPARDYCGSCTRCIDACPTRAIVAPYVLDAGRCISYATIEYRGEDLPGVSDGDFRGWLFGCDICQDVCPWNSFARPSADDRFRPRTGQTAVNLDEARHMSDDTFRERFHHSPVARAKPAGFRRNARWLLEQQNRDASPAHPNHKS